MFCQHGSTENGLFIGKLESDELGFDVVNEFIPKQGDNFKNTTFIIMDFNTRKAWILDDEWIHFNVIRRNGNSRKPTIIVSNSNYRTGYFSDYEDIIQYHKSTSVIQNTFDLS